MVVIKCPYFIISVIFASLSIIFWLFIIPFSLFLAIHVYTKHVKEAVIENTKLNNLVTRIEILERRSTFSNNGR